MQVGARGGALCGGAAGGRAGFDAVYKEEMMKPLDRVRIKCGKDAGRVESCFEYEFVGRVGAEGEERCETCDGGGVRCARAAHDYGEDVDFGTWPVLADGIGEEGVFGADHLSCVGEVVVRAVLPFPHLNLFNRGVSATTVCVPDVSRFEESDKVGFVC